MTSDRIEKVAQVAASAMDGYSEGASHIEDYRIIARALAKEGLLAPTPTPARWWRVIGPDGGVWCETSSESEARQKSRPGDTLQQLWETPPVGQWVTEWETTDG